MASSRFSHSRSRSCCLPWRTRSSLGGAAITIVILGLSWLIGWSGQISLGNSGFMAVGAYTAGIWAHHHATTPLVFTFLLAIWSAAQRTCRAIPSTRLRGPYLAGMTLAFAAAVTPLAQNFTSVTGGEGGLFFNTLLTPSLVLDTSSVAPTPPSTPTPSGPRTSRSSSLA